MQKMQAFEAQQQTVLTPQNQQSQAQIAQELEAIAA